MKKYTEFLFPKLYKWMHEKRLLNELKKWNTNNCPVPPPHIYKQRTITEYKNFYNISVLVETGTFMGEMVEAQKKNFNKIISIELATEFYKNAIKRFAKDSNINILQGDSGKLLNDIALSLTEPAIFWLDGHYSGFDTAKGAKESPILEEIDAIFNNSKFKHILLIDDARCFIGKNDYPTIPEIIKHITTHNKNYNIEIKHDIIRATCS